MYSISIDEIKEKVAKRNRRNDISIQKLELENLNVKEITNEFGERLTRVDGEIPVDLEIEKGKRFLLSAMTNLSLLTIYINTQQNFSQNSLVG